MFDMKDNAVVVLHVGSDNFIDKRHPQSELNLSSSVRWLMTRPERSGAEREIDKSVAVDLPVDLPDAAFSGTGGTVHD